MLDGYQNNTLSSSVQKDFNESNNGSLIFDQQIKTIELIRRNSDFGLKNKIKQKFLNDFDSSHFKEFNDPLDDIEREFKLEAITEKKLYDELDSFDILKKDYGQSPLKTYSLENKEDLKQKYLYNFVTNDIGKPTCFQVNELNIFTINYFNFLIKVSSKYAIIGTNHGFIFIYNLKEKTHSICPPFKREKKVSITCIDVTYDEEIIGCGLLNGYIALYDIISCKLIKNFYSIHSPNATVLALKFYSNNTKSSSKCKLISSDNEGKVYKTLFEKNIFNILNGESFPIIEKNAGNISQIKILKSYILNNSESTKNITVAALASTIKVCVIQIEPRNSVIYILPKPNFIKEIYQPWVSWDEGHFKYQENDTKKNSEKSIFLMICWEKYIDLLAFKEHYDSEQDYFLMTCRVIGSLSLSLPFIYCSFISFNIIVAITENSQVFFMFLDDIKESDESIIKNNENLKENFFFEIKTLFQISNKLLKLEIKSENILCVNSKKDENALFFMDTDDNFTILEISSWQIFINKLMEIDQKRAIFETFKIYEKGNVDFIALIPKITSFRRKNMKEFIKQLLKKYLIYISENKDNKDGELFKEMIKEATKIVLDFIFRMGEIDYFFQEIVKVYKEKALMNILFVCLESYIENKKFRFFF